MSRPLIPFETRQERRLRRTLSTLETAIRQPTGDLDFDIDGDGPPQDMAFLCAFVGDCYRSKGKAHDAIKWYQEGLEAPDIDAEVAMTLLHSLSESYLVLGRNAACEEVAATLTTIRELKKSDSHASVYA